MLFNSMSFAVFLPIVFCLYWMLPSKWKWCLLLVSSYYFYMSWNPKYVVLILFTTCVSYMAGRILESSTSKKIKNTVLSITLVLLLGLLFVFKYFDFFSITLVAFLNRFTLNLHPVTLKLIIPVGISFYTFQTISYVVDVYRGTTKAESNLGIYATFISFFPQLVAGPIERTQDLLPQIRQPKKFDYASATYGLKLMAWGFYKKIVVADNLAPIVDKVYNSPTNYEGFALLIATLLFAFQIYCDFSGYSDIAIGTARLFSINLTKNFDSPYFSSSIKEFWSRWHISLSRWFRDYVYIPLGGNRCSKLRNSINLLITFSVSGLWHGANTTYIIWGGLHGGLQVLEKLLFGKKERKSGLVRNIMSVGIVFVLCCYAWIFFRATNVEQALYVICHMFTGCTTVLPYIKNGCVSLGITLWDGIFFIFIIGVLLIYDYIAMKKDVIEIISSKSTVTRWCVYVIAILFVIFFRAINQTQAFIYFQF